MAESYQPELSQKDRDWLRRELRKIQRQIACEPDCSEVEDQLARDMFYESIGAEIPLEALEYLRVEMLDRTVFYRLIQDTEMGYLATEVGSKSMNPVSSEVEETGYDIDDPEFVLLCGTIFGGARLKGLREVRTVNNQAWLAPTDRVVHERFFTQDANIVLNRRVATLGRLVFRSTFSQEEYETYRALKPEVFDGTDVEPGDIEFRDTVFSRLIAKAISFSEEITGIAAIDKDGKPIVATSQATS